jgi:hypothetical protein
VSEECAFVTAAVTGRNVVPTIVELNVELVFLGKHAQMEFVLELVLLSAPELMEPSELVVGIDATEKVVAVPAPIVTHATSVAVMELASVFPTVTTSTVVTTVVEDPAEPVLMELSVKEPLILFPDNATSTAILICELKSESSKLTTWLVKLARFPSLVPMLSLLPAINIQDPFQDISLLIFQQESMEFILSTLTVQDINPMWRLTL